MKDEPPRRLSRRDLLGGGAILASGSLALAKGSGADPSRARRAERAYAMRMAAARFENDAKTSPSIANGDEKELPSYVLMYSKGLPHNALGEATPGAYEALLRALGTGRHDDFERVPRAGPIKLTNPQGGLACNLIGPDPSAIACPPAPRFASPEQAAEMVELYWQALTRDVPFEEYDSNPLVLRAAEELGRLTGVSTRPSNLFRGSDAGSSNGPYLSQFLWKEIAYSPLKLVQKMRTVPRGNDHLGDYDGWLDTQNGGASADTGPDAVPCYVRNGRDLAEYVHRDFSFQTTLGAALILLKMGAPANPANPYLSSRRQSGFATFGGPHVLSLIATAAHAALTACWFQKWNVHRRLRPEEMGGRIANHLAKRASYPIHESLLGSDALATTLRIRSSALLTSAYPEGAPTHPAYPAGHAVIAAAGTTVLKAFFDERFSIPEPVVCSANGLALKRWDGPPLTLRGELDKLATNIGIGRCFAGIHWRSDIDQGLRLGEEVAIRVLREVHLTMHEPFGGFRFHRLNGESVSA